MRIEHVALWTRNLEALRAFYETYFDAQAGPKYENAARGFASYFLVFPSGARLELMTLPGLWDCPAPEGAEPTFTGYTHLAFAVGAAEIVDALTARLRADGFTVISGPRRTGDGYYESLILDPDGNRVEITI